MMHGEGILVGCDANQEWLLRWWWKHYSQHNPYPVSFMDFGMSQSGVEWCQEHGLYSTLPPLPDLPQTDISPESKAIWEKLYGNGLWDFRSIWFKKPIACLNSPFIKSLWIDLDCRIEKSLSPLFDLLLPDGEIALAREHDGIQQCGQASGLLQKGEIAYNSGVIGFMKNTPVLHLWAKLLLESPHLFPGDQDALSRAIHLRSAPCLELPEIYNWSWVLPHNPNALITHFHGHGKGEILQQLIG